MYKYIKSDNKKNIEIIDVVINFELKNIAYNKGFLYTQNKIKILLTN